MQARLTLGFAPSYARDHVAKNAPTCFVALRPAQIYDVDFAGGVLGTEQKDQARLLGSEGEGLSLLLLSSPGDLVLV